MPENTLPPVVLYFDTETDGLGGFRPPTQRLVQIAWLCGDRSRDELIDDVAEINPQVPHPHTVADCAKRGVPFRQVFDEFMADARKCQKIVAHNLAFDRGTIKHELRLRRIDPKEFEALMDEKGFCTMQTTTEMCQLPRKFGGGYKFPRLEELYTHLFAQRPSLALHDAHNDTTVLRQCHEALLARGIEV